MESNNKLLLLEQIKLSFSKAEISQQTEKNASGDIVINNLPFKGISITISYRIDIDFTDFKEVDYLALVTYFRPRLKQEDCRIFYNKVIMIYLDKKFPLDKKGEFENGMWTFRVLEYFINKIKSILEDITKI